MGYNECTELRIRGRILFPKKKKKGKGKPSSDIPNTCINTARGEALVHGDRDNRKDLVALNRLQESNFTFKAGLEIAIAQRLVPSVLK